MQTERISAPVRREGNVCLSFMKVLSLSLFLLFKGKFDGARQLIGTRGAFHAALIAHEDGRNFLCIGALHELSDGFKVAVAPAVKSDAVKFSSVNFKVNLTAAHAVRRKSINSHVNFSFL